MREGVMVDEGHKHRQEQLKESEAALKKLSVVSVLCITFMLIEFFGGYFSGSMAIMTDAAHLLSDFSGFVISMVSVWIGTKEANRRLSFGFHRAEVIGALASVILIWALTLILVLEAIERIINPVHVDGKIMLITAVFGLIFNLIMVKILHGSGHSHHGCSHNHQTDEALITYEMEELGIGQIKFGDNKDEESLHLKDHDSLMDDEDHAEHQLSKSYDMDSVKLDTKESKEGVNRSDVFDLKRGESKEQLENKNEDHAHTRDGHSHHNHHDHGHHHTSSNLNVRAAAIHIIGDIIQAIGVLLAAILIYLCPSWQIIDPIWTFMFSILVMFTTYFIVKDCMIILLEGVPTDLEYEEVKTSLKSIQGVSSIKELHIWSLTSGKNCLAAKLVGKNNNQIVIDAHEICKVKFKIKKWYIEVNTV